jgi:hypothetical protein
MTPLVGTILAEIVILCFFPFTFYIHTDFSEKKNKLNLTLYRIYVELTQSIEYTELKKLTFSLPSPIIRGSKK